MSCLSSTGSAESQQTYDIQFDPDSRVDMPLAGNLDTARQQFLELYFPREVKAKAKSNSKEIDEEEAERLGIATTKCCIS